jgi:hypothetical protein
MERDSEAPERLAKAASPLGRLPSSDTMTEDDAIAALLDLGGDKGRIQLELYMLSLEIEEVSGALGRLPPSGGGGRRRLKRGGGEIANKAYRWLMSTIGGGAGAVMAASVAVPDTAAALVELGTALLDTPDKARATADAATAKAIRSAIPAARAIGSFATAGVGLAGASYLFNHPSLVVGVGDIATRIAIAFGGASGALGPNWATFIKEGTAIGQMVLSASGNAAITIASRPYLIAAISYVLLAEYARHKGKSVRDIISDSSKAVGSRMISVAKSAASKGMSAVDKAASAVKATASSAASGVGAFGADVGSVLSATLIDDFNTWLEQRRIPGYDALIELGQVTKQAIAERAKAAAEETFQTARAARAKARELKKAVAERDAAIASAVAPMAQGPPGEGAAEQGAVGMQQGQGRRLTSRRRRRAAYLPRQTRRSSSGRRRGYSRRRRE